MLLNVAFLLLYIIVKLNFSKQTFEYLCIQFRDNWKLWS